jgi:hypothetical protein
MVTFWGWEISKAWRKRCARSFQMCFCVGGRRPRRAHWLWWPQSETSPPLHIGCSSIFYLRKKKAPNNFATLKIGINMQQVHIWGHFNSGTKSFRHYHPRHLLKLILQSYLASHVGVTLKVNITKLKPCTKSHPLWVVTFI